MSSLKSDFEKFMGHTVFTVFLWSLVLFLALYLLQLIICSTSLEKRLLDHRFGDFALDVLCFLVAIAKIVFIFYGVLIIVRAFEFRRYVNE